MQAGMVLVNGGRPGAQRGLDAHQGTAVVGNFGSVLHRHRPTSIWRTRRNLCLAGVSELLSPELTEQAGEYELKGISGKTSL